MPRKQEKIKTRISFTVIPTEEFNQILQDIRRLYVKMFVEWLEEQEMNDSDLISQGEVMVISNEQQKG